MGGVFLCVAFSPPSGARPQICFKGVGEGALAAPRSHARRRYLLVKRRGVDLGLLHVAWRRRHCVRGAGGVTAGLRFLFVCGPGRRAALASRRGKKAKCLVRWLVEASTTQARVCVCCDLRAQGRCSGRFVSSRPPKKNTRVFRPPELSPPQILKPPCAHPPVILCFLCRTQPVVRREVRVGVRAGRVCVCEGACAHTHTPTHARVLMCVLLGKGMLVGWRARGVCACVRLHMGLPRACVVCVCFVCV